MNLKRGEMKVGIMAKKDTIEWDFMDEDEAVFIKKVIALIHTYYEKPPADYMIIAAWLMKKRLEEIDGPQINDITNDWTGDLN